MNWTYYKTLLGFLALIFLAGCQEDRPFEAPVISAPSNVSATFTIANDNSGTLTVVPTADGAVSFTINFGDGGEPMEIGMGTSASHVYAEGDYTMTITAKSVDGQTAVMTQAIVIRFTAPENLTVDIAVSAKTAVVKPTADGATLFEVYFGEAANETPMTIMPGESASHGYAEPGLYTVRVVAKGAGAATAEYSEEIETFNLVLLPLTFEQNDISFIFNGFGGASAGVVNNPKTDGNASNNVVRFVKQDGSEVWAGVVLDLSERVDFNAFKKIKMKLWSPKAGINVIIKLENLENADINTELTVVTNQANAWEDLLFDFSAVDPSLDLRRLVIFVDFGTVGMASEEFFFDDIKLTNEGVAGLGIPLDFESDQFVYEFTGFGGAGSERVDNPNPSGINSSSKVAKLNKGDGSEVWAGTFIDLANDIDFSTDKIFRVKTHSPKAGALVRLKVEDINNPDNFFEADANTTVAGAWEALDFDFGGVDVTKSFARVVIFFDFGNNGDGSDYYYDDFELVSSEPVAPRLPMNFEENNVVYTFADFGNAFSSVVDNPDPSGINTSAKVGQSVKVAGAEVWAGGFVTLRSAMDFANNKTIKVKVWSPKSGAVVKVKVENSANPDLNHEVDVTTTTANAWEELSYDFSAINTDNAYDRFVIFFDFGNGGDDSTYFFDDVRLEN